MKPSIKLIGAAKSSLIINLNGQKCYCSNKNYVKLVNDPDVMYRIVTVPSHIGCCRHDPTREITFPDARWVEVADFKRF